MSLFFFRAEDGIRDYKVTGVQTCALPISAGDLPHRVSEWIRVTVEPEMAIEWDQISALDGIDEVRLFLDTPDRSEERRVGKECRSRRGQSQEERSSDSGVSEWGLC